MEQFRKWDKKEYPYPPTYERGPVGREALKQRKVTWKAALGWALSIMEKDREQGWPIKASKITIRKELEE